METESNGQRNTTWGGKEQTLGSETNGGKEQQVWFVVKEGTEKRGGLRRTVDETTIFGAG
jgi:hypothetical protein